MFGIFYFCLQLNALHFAATDHHIATYQKPAHMQLDNAEFSIQWIIVF